MLWNYRKRHQYFTRSVGYGKGRVIRCHKQRSLECKAQKSIKAHLKLSRIEFRRRKKSRVSQATKDKKMS